jgi:FkbM family methyltransferase
MPTRGAAECMLSAAKSFTPLHHSSTPPGRSGKIMIKSLMFKLDRMAELTRLVGLIKALEFEVMWSTRRPEIEISLTGFSGSFIIRRFSSDINVFSSVFIDRELETYLPEDPRFIIDGGANVGYTTAFYAQRFPNTTIIAVEPSKSNLTQLRRNCSGYNNVVFLEGALWPVFTPVGIVNPEAESWSYQVEAGDDSSSVQGYPIEDIMRIYSIKEIDLLKLDIEGAERFLFESEFGRWLPCVKAIVVEIHNEEARAAIEGACNSEDFHKTKSGEKLLFIRNC